MDAVQQKWVHACQQIVKSGTTGRTEMLSWDGMFLERLPWTPSFVQEWLEKEVIEHGDGDGDGDGGQNGDHDHAKPDSKDTHIPVRSTVTLQLYPPIYTKWIQCPLIANQLIVHVRLWCKMHVVGTSLLPSIPRQPPHGQLPTLRDIRTILQLCFDLDMIDEYEQVWEWAMARNLSDLEVAYLMHVF